MSIETNHSAIVLSVIEQISSHGAQLSDGETAMESDADRPGWVLQKQGSILTLSFTDNGVSDTMIELNVSTGEMIVRQAGKLQKVDPIQPMNLIKSEHTQIHAEEVYAALGTALSYMDMSTYLELVVGLGS